MKWIFIAIGYVIVNIVSFIWELKILSFKDYIKSLKGCGTDLGRPSMPMYGGPPPPPPPRTIQGNKRPDKND